MQSGVVVIFFSNNVNFNSLACIEKFVCHSICIVGDKGVTKMRNRPRLVSILSFFWSR